jgi:hypothetical protein
MKGSLHFISLQSALLLRAPFLNASSFFDMYVGTKGSRNLRNVKKNLLSYFIMISLTIDESLRDNGLSKLAEPASYLASLARKFLQTGVTLESTHVVVEYVVNTGS